jgi:hypothetical protein
MGQSLGDPFLIGADPVGDVVQCPRPFWGAKATPVRLCSLGCRRGPTQLIRTCGMQRGVGLPDCRVDNSELGAVTDYEFSVDQ